MGATRMAELLAAHMHRRAQALRPAVAAAVEEAAAVANAGVAAMLDAVPRPGAQMARTAAALGWNFLHETGSVLMFHKLLPAAGAVLQVAIVASAVPALLELACGQLTYRFLGRDSLHFMQCFGAVVVGGADIEPLLALPPDEPRRATFLALHAVMLDRFGWA